MLISGYGNSKDVAKLSSKSAFIAAVVKTLNLNRPVIVSPSMSGGFSLPYLFDDPATALDKSRGFIPVAPVETGKYLEAYYKKSQVRE